jgi:hypothetical protein
MTQLTRHQDNLSSMMTLVSDEIGKDMPDVKRQIPPRIRPRGRDASAVLTPELEQALDPAAASAQAFCQFPRSHPVPVHAGRDADTMRAAQRFDPHAPGVVNMARDHPNGAARNTRDGCRPKFEREVFDEKDRNPVVRGPGGQDRVTKVRGR